jgi:hypothetical protein
MKVYVNTRNLKTEAYFKGVLDKEAEKWREIPLEQRPRLMFQQQHKHYIYWDGNLGSPVSTALFHYVRRYAEKVGIPVWISGRNFPFDQAGTVWDLVQECAANIESGRGSISDTRYPHAIYVRKLPDRRYELIRYGGQASLLIDQKLFEYAKRLANAEGVLICVSET